MIFLCQNNQIGEHTPIAAYTASKDFASRAQGYGFKGVRLDSYDLPAFYQGMKTVTEEVRRGQGPCSSRRSPIGSVRMRVSGIITRCRPRN